MKRSSTTCFAAALVTLAGCALTPPKMPVASSVSPDGRNEIRLFTDPLAYEVVRDGVSVVAPSAMELTVNGDRLSASATLPKISKVELSGTEPAPIYKKGTLNLRGNETLVDFGTWAVRLSARDDGVAYRFETKFAGRVTVNGETAALTIPDARDRTWACYTGGVGQEESVEVRQAASDLRTEETEKKDWEGKKMIYLPFVYTTGGKFVAVTESDVVDYPIWNLTRDHVSGSLSGSVMLDSFFPAWPKNTFRAEGWGKAFHRLPDGGRWVWVGDTEDYLVKTAGTRTYPWRTFVLGDDPSAFPEAEIVRALARPGDPKADFSWVKPGKVAWDWWNDWNLDPVKDQLDFKPGCNTKTYEYYIDFASTNGIEYVIFDEGWSEALNIWKFHPNVDVPHLIQYAAERNVGIILWLAWAQAYGDEARVVEHFAQLGAKGFKVDFMDRGDAEVARFLERFAAECQKHRMVVDYHGVYRPNGLERRFPNVLNYEGIHGLEQMKFYKGYDMMAHDVAAFYMRLTAGPMDYTPGAMQNVRIDYENYKSDGHNPSSMGTRCRQMAMMVLYEAPLQMLCDSPAQYALNLESFAFMAKTPVVWNATVGLAGSLDTVAAVARQAKDGAWYAAAITDKESRDYVLDTAFLPAGEWEAEVFRDAGDADYYPVHYVHETAPVTAGAKLAFHLAKGGGFVVRFVKR